MYMKLYLNMFKKLVYYPFLCHYDKVCFFGSVVFD